MLFTRHRWFWPYSLLAGTMIFVVASASEVEGGVNRVLLGLCGLAIAGLAATEYWVLAETTRGLVLLRSSRIRQYAQSVARRLPEDTTIDPVGSTVVTGDWRIDGVLYTSTKRWEAAMRRLSGTP